MVALWGSTGWASRDAVPIGDGMVTPFLLHALVIGIDVYKSPAIDNLMGAVADAEAMAAYLRDDLHVPNGHIVKLHNEAATRDAIIREIKALRAREGIRQGDPILIYFAGHGTTAAAPMEWHSGNGRVSLIVPYDADRKRQNNEITRYAIPDRTIGALLHNLAEGEGGCGIGNNITVIFDCCHSGSGTRDMIPTSSFSDSRRTRGFTFEGDIPATLDQEALHEGGRVRDINAPEGFAHVGAKSHILLAACREDEFAFEDNKRGYFTRQLLAALRTVRPDETTYQELMRRVAGIPGQNPQCEGHHVDRLLFRMLVPGRRRAYRMKPLTKGEFLVHIGLVNGVAEGTQFSVYMDGGYQPDTLPMTMLVASKVRAFASVLTFGECSTPEIRAKLDVASTCFAVPESLVGTTAALCSYLSNSVQRDHIPVQEALKDLVSLPKANSGQANGGDPIHDILIAGHDLLAKAEASETHPVLSRAAGFIRHLSHAPEESVLKRKVETQVYRLQSDSCTDLGEGWRRPWIAQGPNLFDPASGVVNVIADSNTSYGILLRNGSTVPLHVWAFYFNDRTLAISECYRPPTTDCNAEGVLPGRCDHKKCDHRRDIIAQGEPKGELTIGYGAGGGQPYQFSLRPDQDQEVGYIKFFFSTQPMDLSDIEQHSRAHHTTRSRDIKVKKNPVDMWDTVLMTVVQRRPGTSLGLIEA